MSDLCGYHVRVTGMYLKVLV